MEDYDVFGEMQNLKDKQVVAFIEDDEDFIVNNLINSDNELIPIRFSYDLSCFSKPYVEKTKTLFTYYFNKDNTFNNELLPLKKHFVHFQRFPFIVYIPLDSKYCSLIQMMHELDIECVHDKNLFISKISNNKKMILIDNDDTLTRSDGIISHRTKKAIKDNKKNGNIIVICTSRPRYQAIEVAKKVGTTNIVISSNGAEIYDISTNKIIDGLYIDKNEILNFVKCAYLNDIRLVLSTGDTDYVTKEVRNANQILIDKSNYNNQLSDLNIKQCMFISSNKNEIKKIKNQIKKNKKVHIVDETKATSNSSEEWFSVSNSNVSKGNALIRLSNYLKIPLKNTIAIGNDKNDISMFNSCGFSVAVANAVDLIKSNVDYVTLSNNNDGVATFLEKLIQ